MFTKLREREGHSSEDSAAAKQKQRDKRRSTETINIDATRNATESDGSMSSEAGDQIPPEFKWLDKRNKKRSDKVQRSFTSQIKQVDEKVEEVANKTVVIEDRLDVFEKRLGLLESSGELRGSSGTAGASADLAPTSDVNSVEGTKGTKVIIKGFHYNTPKQTIINVCEEHWGTMLGSDRVQDKYVPGKRSSVYILKCVSNKTAWEIVKHISANRKEIWAPKPLSNDKTAIKQRPWATFEQSESDRAHSSLVGRAVRTLFKLKDQKILAQDVEIESNYGKSKTGGTIVLNKESTEGLVANIKEGQVVWEHDSLHSFGVSKEQIDDAWAAL